MYMEWEEEKHPPFGGCLAFDAVTALICRAGLRVKPIGAVAIAISAALPALNVAELGVNFGFGEES